MIKPGQIVYCNIKCKTLKNKIMEVKGIVYASEYSGFNPNLSFNNSDDRFTIRKFNVKEDLIITGIEIIKELGFKNKSKEFTEVKASDEKRNKITGAYE